MTWIKTEYLMPPKHEVILFRDRFGNEHYGVLCGDLSKKEHRNKFWCHVFKSVYDLDDVIYWCEIPINKHQFMADNEFSIKVNEFLLESTMDVENQILKDFKKMHLENPNWGPEDFVRISIRNGLYRLMKKISLNPQ